MTIISASTCGDCWMKASLAPTFSCESNGPMDPSSKVLRRLEKTNCRRIELSVIPTGERRLKRTFQIQRNIFKALRDRMLTRQVFAQEEVWPLPLWPSPVPCQLTETCLVLLIFVPPRKHFNFSMYTIASYSTMERKISSMT